MIKSKPKSIPKPKVNSYNSSTNSSNNKQPNNDLRKHQQEGEISNYYEDEPILLCLNPIDPGGQTSLSKTRKRVTFRHPISQDACNKLEKPNKSSKSTKKKSQVTTIVENVRILKSSLKFSVSESNNLRNGFKADWYYTSTRWAARLEHLAELESGNVKVLQAKHPISASVFYCENQRHFVLGNGPDFSAAMLGIIENSTEVVVKKINVKRVPLLLNENHSKSLVALPDTSQIAKVHFIIKDKTHFYVVRELCENSLKCFIRMRQYLLESTKEPLDCSKLCHDIAKSLEVLHSNDIVHMSIKPENVFVTMLGDAKLADYGMHDRCSAKKKQYSNGSSAVCWLPSEVLEKNDKPVYTKASDICSLGILFYYIFTEGKHPFGDPENAADACANNILHGQYNLKLISNSFAHHLIKNMIFKEPEKRMSVDEVLKHPYLWPDEKKNEFVEYLAKFVALASKSDIFNKKVNVILQKIKLEGPSVIQNSINTENPFDFPNKFKNELTSMLHFIHDSSESKNHDRESNEIFKRFWSIYPGVILDFYHQISIDELIKLIKDMEEAANLDKAQQPFEYIDFRALKPTLSADSGVVSPMDVPGAENGEIGLYDDITTFSFVGNRTRHRNYSDCCTSTTTDDGIDLLSPLSGSFTDENMFSSPIKIVPNQPLGFSDKWKSSNHAIVSPKSCASSIDNQYEFDGEGYMGNHLYFGGEKMNVKKKHTVLETVMPLWTDMDELD